MKSEQLLLHIGEIDPNYVESAERKAEAASHREKTSRIDVWLMRLAPIAACLVVAVAVAAIFGNNAGWFGGKVYTTELSGGTLSFHKANSSPGSASYAYMEGVDCTARALTEEERELLYGEAFGGRDYSAEGVFALGDKWGPDKSLIHVTARSGWSDLALQVTMAQGPINSIIEMMIFEDVRTAISEINGIQVSAGYFITRKNSMGERNIFYMASYEIGGDKVYVGLWGSLERSEEIRAEIASVIDTLTQKGAPNLSGILY